MHPYLVDGPSSNVNYVHRIFLSAIINNFQAGLRFIPLLGLYFSTFVIYGLSIYFCSICFFFSTFLFIFLVTFIYIIFLVLDVSGFSDIVPLRDKKAFLT